MRSQIGGLKGVDTVGDRRNGLAATESRAIRWNCSALVPAQLRWPISKDVRVLVPSRIAE